MNSVQLCFECRRVVFESCVCASFITSRCNESYHRLLVRQFIRCFGSLCLFVCFPSLLSYVQSLVSAFIHSVNRLFVRKWSVRLNTRFLRSDPKPTAYTNNNGYGHNNSRNRLDNCMKWIEAQSAKSSSIRQRASVTVAEIF